MERRTTFALASAILAAVVVGIATFGGDEQGWREYVVTLVVIAVTTAIVFWLVVPRVVRAPATPALLLAVLGLASVVVFWLGLPIVLGGGATLLALEARERRVGMTAASLALALAVLAVALAVVGAFIA